MFYDIDNFLFDFDGTIVDTQWVYNEIDKELITRNGRIPSNTINEERINFFAKHNLSPNPFSEYMNYLINTYNLDCSIQELCLQRDEFCAIYQRERVQLKPNADIFLKELKQDGKKLFLTTVSRPLDINNICYQNNHIREKCDLADIFGGNILTLDDVKEKKPNEEVYLMGLKILNAKISNSIAIEDSLNGIESAKRAGLKVIAIYDKHSDFDRDKINALADYKVDGYDELIYQYRKTKRS